MISEQVKSDILALSQRLGDGVLEGRIEFALVISRSPDGSVQLNWRGGNVHEALGMLQVSQTTLLGMVAGSRGSDEAR